MTLKYIQSQIASTLTVFSSTEHWIQMCEILQTSPLDMEEGMYTH